MGKLWSTCGKWGRFQQAMMDITFYSKYELENLSKPF